MSQERFGWFVPDQPIANSRMPKLIGSILGVRDYFVINSYSYLFMAINKYKQMGAMQTIRETCFLTLQY